MKTLKALALILGLSMLTATQMNAQNDGSRGLFGMGPSGEASPHRSLLNPSSGNITNQTYGSDADGFGITNQTYGQDAPLGSGLLIMVLAGACYAGMKRNKKQKGKTMRKYNFILMAFALLLGMSQCKKEPATPNGDNNGGVRITLKVDDGDNGEKLNVYPATGAVIFTQGDKIYVGNNGKYVGTLTFDNGLFQGTIDSEICSTTDYLHFYFVGNKPTYPSTLSSGTSTYTVDISDQSAGLPAISYAPSTAKYSPSTTAYTAKLLNKSALVKFVPSTATSQPITVSGLYNEVQIDFANHTLAPTGNTGGITLYSVSDTEKWAILLAQEAVSDATVTIRGYDASASVPRITNNMYCNSGVSILMTATNPEGAINGKFTVAEGKQVYFSQGNLQYIGSAATPYWKFADNQWDVLGTTTDQTSSDQNVDRDLFGWGTSGWNNGNTYYHPWDTDRINSNLYGPPGLYDLTGTYANADWGVYNPISNGGNQANQWRTLTQPEWAYVFNSRTGAASKWGHGNVKGVNGMILLPDDWTLPEGLSFTSGNSRWANVYNAEQWAQMEANGAVFLPAAGWRSASVRDVGVIGGYWSASYYSSSDAYFLYFYDSNLNPQLSNYRYHGFSVRLVRSAQ